VKRLANRIQNVGAVNAAAMGAYHPVGTKDTPMVMPVAAVTVTTAPDGQYSAVAYEEITPIWTTDGAAIPAKSPGNWGQLRRAGQP
jgi:hypothetical protein